jgi:phosphate transport system substrate-binding protein
MVKFRTSAGTLAAVLAIALVAAACSNNDNNGGEPSNGGNPDLTGSLNISGSSTVEPITSLVAEKFQTVNPGVDVAVDGPGTSDGFELFCNGETDIQDASRQIKDEEVTACKDGNVEYVELEIALDALSVIVNPSNPLSCLTIGDLYALFGPESEGFTTWSDANSLALEVGGKGGLPDEPLTIVAPGEESGTYGSFIDLVTKSIAGDRGAADDALRPDYQISADDNVIVDNAAGTPGGIGFVGFSYAQNAGDTVKELQIDAGDGCVAPSADTVHDGTYPLGRSLYLYVNKEKITSNPAVRPFVDFYLTDEGLASVDEVQYISLTPERVDATRSTWESESALT